MNGEYNLLLLLLFVVTSGRVECFSVLYPRVYETRGLVTGTEHRISGNCSSVLETLTLSLLIWRARDYHRQKA